MPLVSFTPNLRRHLNAAPATVEGDTLAAVLERLFLDRPELRGYLLDDQGGVRRHVAIFVDGRRVRDHRGLSDPVHPSSEIHVIQALSGG